MKSLLTTEAQRTQRKTSLTDTYSVRALGVRQRNQAYVLLLRGELNQFSSSVCAKLRTIIQDTR